MAVRKLDEASLALPQHPLEHSYIPGSNIRRAQASSVSHCGNSRQPEDLVDDDGCKDLIDDDGSLQYDWLLSGALQQDTQSLKSNWI